MLPLVLLIEGLPAGGQQIVPPQNVDSLVWRLWVYTQAATIS